MIERRPTERLVTADDLQDRDMWYDPEELYPYMDAQDAAIEQLQHERDEAVELARRAHAWIDHGVKTISRAAWCTEFERLLSHIKGEQDE